VGGFFVCIVNDNIPFLPLGRVGFVVHFSPSSITL